MRNKQRYLIPSMIWCLTLFLTVIVLPVACSSIPDWGISQRPNLTKSLPVVSSNAVVYSEDLLWYERYWVRETHRRYPNALIIMAHGFNYQEEWWCEYTGLRLIRVTDLVKLTRKQYPVRRIVLVICNPGGYTLTLSNVSYSLENVWVMPDRAIHPRSTITPNSSGNIYEMQENQ